MYTFSHSSDSGNTHVLVINILCIQYIFSLKTKKYWALCELQYVESIGVVTFSASYIKEVK